MSLQSQHVIVLYRDIYPIKNRCHHNIACTLGPPALNSKFERMCGYNCSFIIEKESFVEWMAATEGELTHNL